MAYSNEVCTAASDDPSNWEAESTRPLMSHDSTPILILKLFMHKMMGLRSGIKEKLHHHFTKIKLEWIN